MAQRESCGSQQGDKLTVRSTHCIEQKEEERPRLQHVDEAAWQRMQALGEPEYLFEAGKGARGKK